MLTRYEKLRRLSSDSPAKQQVITRAEQKIEDLIGHFKGAGYTEEEVLSSIIVITEHKRQEQEALCSDAQMNSPKVKIQELYAAIGGAEGSEPYSSFIAKRQTLADKWVEMVDSEERRLLGNLLFPELKSINVLGAAILADNLDFYRAKGWGAGEYWKVRVSMACLFGSQKNRRISFE